MVENIKGCGVPRLTDDKTWIRYHKELRTWNTFTSVKKEDRGSYIVIYGLQDGSAIKERIMEEMELEEWNCADGFKNVVTFLEKHLKKDELTDRYEKYVDFETYERKTGDDIKTYVQLFDQKYNRVRKLGMKISSQMLGLKLLMKANLTDSDRMLVMTGMDYADDDTLYDQTVASLRKFKGEMVSSPQSAPSPAIKLEPAFLAEHEEALAAAGYFKRNDSQMRRGGRNGWSPRYQQGDRRNGSSSSQTKRLNKKGPDGQVLRCFECDSTCHFAKNCPHKSDNHKEAHMVQTENSAEHVVCFTEGDSDALVLLSREAQNCAVLDSACSSTVCGEEWISTYTESLSEEDRKLIKSSPGEKWFKFGAGSPLHSNRHMEIPAYMVGQRVTIKTDVVDSEIPLLLSKKAMKSARIKLDLENDTAEVLGKEVVLNDTTSGHYCLPITKSETSVESVCAVELEGMTDAEQKQTLIKLHRQFAHPTQNRLMAFMKDAGVWREKYQLMLNDIHEKCKICKMYKKTPPRPVVTLPIANRFNQVVTLDLKKWDEEHILHMIDMWSRLTVSVFIPRKDPKIVTEKIMTNWVSTGYGIMESLYTDNGGEFNSEESREVASVLNVKLLATAAQSPFQNGLNERNHYITDNMLQKMIEDYPGIPKETLLIWANVAKNSLQMWHGFSSYQLVFGCNPTLPNVMTDKLPSLEGVTTSKVLCEQLNALHAAREAFIKSEANERIRRALRSKVRASEEYYSSGDIVFYKRDGKDKWLGPGKVLYQDGRVVYIKHGGYMVRVSPNRLVKANKSQFDVDGTDMKDSAAEKSEAPENTEVIPEVPVDNTEVADESRPTVADQSRRGVGVKVKSQDQIQYRSNTSDDWSNAVITGRAGKATGKYNNWYNIKTDNGDELYIDLQEVEWRKIEDEDVEAAYLNLIPRKQHQQPECVQAKKTELQKLKSFDVYEEVADVGQSCISTTWVLWMKGETHRARLVARGFEEEQYIQSDSPTVTKSSIRLIVAISAAMQWEVKTTDIKSAFLQGKRLEREIYLIPPGESDTPEGMIWRLKKCLYGLNDAARMFYASISEVLSRLGCIKSTLDPALFYCTRDNKLIGIMGSHIDDFIHTGTAEFENVIMEKLRDRFLAGKVESSVFRYVGFDVKQTESCVILDQNEYVNSLPMIKLSLERASQTSDPLSKKESTVLRSIAGKLNWIVQGTRPDVAFELIDLSTKFNKATVSDLNRAIKVLRKTQDGDAKLCFQALHNVKLWKLIVFTDASFASLNERIDSVGGHIIFLVGCGGKCSPLAWRACKLQRVVQSTIAAETLSLLNGLGEAINLQNQINDLMNLSVPIIAYVDNRSVYHAVYTTSLVGDHALRREVGAIKQMLETGQVNAIRWCPGDKQLANSLTKRGASPKLLLQVLHTGNLNIPGLDLNAV